MTQKAAISPQSPPNRLGRLWLMKTVTLDPESPSPAIAYSFLFRWHGTFSFPTASPSCEKLPYNKQFKCSLEVNWESSSEVFSKQQQDDSLLWPSELCVWGHRRQDLLLSWIPGPRSLLWVTTAQPFLSPVEETLLSHFLIGSLFDVASYFLEEVCSRLTPKRWAVSPQRDWAGESPWRTTSGKISEAVFPPRPIPYFCEDSFL